jgi:hypothetical protein
VGTGFPQRSCSKNELERDEIIALEERSRRRRDLTHIDGEIRGGRHHMQVRVYYEDTDFSDRTLS